MKTIKNLMAALMISCCGIAAARADEPKAEAPKTVQTSPAEPGQLTVESLKEMLDTLGYDFKVEKTSAGNPLHMVKLSRGGLDYEINVNLSSSRTKLWTSVALADVSEQQAAQADKLLKLLELNQKIGPSHFYYYTPHKMIYIAKPMDNRGVTAKALREHIDGLMEQIVANREAWDTARWNQTATAVAPK